MDETSQICSQDGHLETTNPHLIEPPKPSWITKQIKFIKNGEPFTNHSHQTLLLIPAKELKEINRDLKGDDESLKKLVHFIQSEEGWNIGEPMLLINVIGDCDHSHLSTECLIAAIKSLFRMTENTWLLSSGYGVEFNKVVGRGVTELSAECNRIKNSKFNVHVTSIGICHWSEIIGREEVEEERPYDYGNDSKNHKMTLNHSNTHYVGVVGDEFKASALRQVLFETFPVPRVSLLVGGGKKTIHDLVASLSVGIPCILIEDSGGLASLLASVIHIIKTSNKPIDSKLIVATLSQMQKQEGDGIDPTVNPSFRQCIDKYDHFVICTAQNFQKKEVQELLLRRHLEMQQNCQTHLSDTFQTNFLKLCESWNCLNLAIDALGRFDDLQHNIMTECLIAYLQSGKVPFVNLLIKYNPKAFKLLHQKDFRELYSCNKISLRVIKELCKKEVADISGLQEIAEEITSIINWKEEEEEDPFDQEFHIFIWCLLLKHYMLGRYFWRRCDFPIANGLIASSLLKSLVKLGKTDLESNKGRLQEAKRYEEWASQLLTQCDDQSQTRTKFLLLQNIHSRGNISCLQLATNNDEYAIFLKNPVCIRHLNDIWLRCGLSDWTTLLSNLFISLFLIIALVLFSSCLHSFNAATLFVGFLFAIVFIIGFTIYQKERHRCSYKEFRPVNDEEEQTDLDMLQKLEKHEANLLLQVGIPADLIYEEIHNQSNAETAISTALSPINIPASITVPLLPSPPPPHPQIPGTDVTIVERDDQMTQTTTNFDDVSKLSMCSSCSHRFFHDWLSHLKLFMDTPQIKFVLHVSTFSVFLSIFAFLILSAPPNFSVTPPSPMEWLLILYWLSFMAHEVKQFCRGDVKRLTKARSGRMMAKFKSYFDSFWNRFDITLLVYFIIMMCIRISFVVDIASFNLANQSFNSANLSSNISLSNTSEDKISLSQLLMSVGMTKETNYVFVLNVYSLYFVFWCMKLLQLFAVSEVLGPKLIMIRLMIYDAFNIFLYIMIFALAYAVWLKVAMKTVSEEFLQEERAYHVDSPSWTITDVLHFPGDLIGPSFWHLFGESFIETYEKLLPLRNDTGAYAYEYRVTTILLMAPFMRIIYVLITVVLLLNLMIAIFQYSIDLVQTQANRNWIFFRKAVIFEYHSRAILPAPLSLILDVGSLLCLFFHKCRGKKWCPCFVKPSRRFKCSTLKICVTGTQSDDNPFAKWLEYIKHWEKTLQNHHTSIGAMEGAEMIGRGASSGGGKGEEERGGNPSRDLTRVKEAVSADVLQFIELKDEIRKLQLEMSKMTEMSKSFTEKNRKQQQEQQQQQQQEQEQQQQQQQQQ